MVYIITTPVKCLTVCTTVYYKVFAVIMLRVKERKGIRRGGKVATYMGGI